jgi:hypothetical protein
MRRRFVRCIPTWSWEWMVRSWNTSWKGKRKKKGWNLDTELTAEDWKGLVAVFKAKVKALGKSFPDDPQEQL